MSVDEITDRVRYRIWVSRERRQYRSGTLVQPDRLARAIGGQDGNGDWKEQLLAARRTTSGRFFPSVTQQEMLKRLFSTRFRQERADTLAFAHQARAFRFEFFGREYSYEPDIPWQVDPVTQKPWPGGYHADVPVHRGDVGAGDVKHVWELSRQQYLIDLGKAHFLEGDKRDLLAIRTLVRSWIAGNPYGSGVNWACALEPAFRLWSWLWAYHLVQKSLDDEFHIEWLEAFYDHGHFLSMHLEHYSSPYNHLIGEAAALFAVALCFPEFQASREWARQARHVLESRLGQQFYADGGSVEQSMFYHHATTGFYLLAAILGRENRNDLSPRVWRAIEQGIEYSMIMSQPDGKTPAIGGADDGKPIRMEHMPFWDFRPYQAIGAVMFNRPDFRSTAQRFYEDALWLLGADGPATFDRLDAGASPPVRAELLGSGYFVDRSGWSEDADYVCFDVGEQAAGMRPDGVPNSMHGHADCLSVIVWLQGHPVLVDSGLYAYNSGDQWEAHFRETAAHNTARVDGRDQALHLGKMAWSHSYRPTVEGRFADERQAWTIGSHDGFARGTNGVTHRRAVWLRPNGYVLLCDEFEGTGEHDLEINFQFAPGRLVLSANDEARFNDTVQTCWVGEGTWSSSMAYGGENPDQGWICTSLGVRVPAPRLTLRCRSAAPRTRLVTVLATSNGAQVRVSAVKCGAQGTTTLLRISGRDYVDWVGASGLSGDAPIQTDGLLAVCRLDLNGLVTETAQAGGMNTRVDVAALSTLGALHPSIDAE